MNLASTVHGVAARHPGAPAVTHAGSTWTYAEFSRRIARTAAWLRALPGVKPGERIGIAMENGSGYLQVVYACWHAGLCAVPMNAKLHPREICYILENAQALVCVASPALYQGIREQAGSGAAFRLVEADAATLARMAESSAMDPADGAPEDPAWLFYTSGTTGRPKGATLTRRNLLFMTLAYLRGHRPARRARHDGARRAALARLGHATPSPIWPAARTTSSPSTDSRRATCSRRSSAGPGCRSSPRRRCWCG